MAAERVIHGNPSLYRIRVQYSAYFTVQEPEIPQDKPPALLTTLHGYGQSSKVFIKNFSRLRQRNFRYYSHAGRTIKRFKSRNPARQKPLYGPMDSTLKRIISAAGTKCRLKRLSR